MRDDHRMLERDEIRLNRGQIIWVTLGALGSLGLVFGLGVVVGKRVAKLDEPQVAAAQGSPMAQIDANLKFYSQLTNDAEPSSGRAPAPSPSLAAAKGKNLSPPPVNPALPPSALPPSGRSAMAFSPSSPSAPLTEGPLPRLDGRSGLAAGPAQRGEYTVQVSSFQTREEAAAFSAGLERKGFRPFVVPAVIPQKGTWYRVRLGRFTNEGQAREAKQELARADIPAWVLRAD